MNMETVKKITYEFDKCVRQAIKKRTDIIEIFSQDKSFDSKMIRIAKKLIELKISAMI